MPTDTTVEQDIQARGLTAPRVTPLDIEAEIAHEAYFTAGDGVCGVTYRGGHHVSPPFPGSLDRLTLCVLTLRNGFTVTGESACASSDNFDAAIGRKIARQNATDKMWSLLGFRLRDQLASK